MPYFSQFQKKKKAAGGSLGATMSKTFPDIPRESRVSDGLWDNPELLAVSGLQIFGIGQ